MRLDSAVYFIERAEYSQAMLQLKQAEMILPQLDDDKQKYQICQYIGWVNEHSGAYAHALDYQEKALGMERQPQGGGVIQRG